MAMSSEKKIHVLIADDHAILRQGLRQIISGTDDMLVAGEAVDGVDAMRLARQVRWDVLLLDITMPNRSGIDTLKMLRHEFPRQPVLMLSMHEEDQYAVRAIKAGAAGYLTKQSAPELLITAIRQVVGGQKYVSPSLAMKLADMIAENDDRPLHESLSDREYQTLRMIAAGLPLTQIAEDLSISVKTVSEYRKRILEKMKLHSNAELIHYGLKHGLVD